MVMFFALLSMEFIVLNSSDLVDYLVMLLTSTLTINCSPRNFLNKAIGIINFAKKNSKYTADTMI